MTVANHLSNLVAELMRTRTAHEDASEVERQQRACDRVKQSEWRRRVHETIPVAARDVAWEGRDTFAMLAVKRWLHDGMPRDLMLRGGVGCGKTTAIAYAAIKLLEPAIEWRVEGPVVLDRNPQVVWLRPDALVSAICHAYDPSAPKLARYIVIDDIGRETKGDFGEALCEVLDRAGHVLMMTSNLNRSSFRARYDLRVLDRLNERAIAIDVPGGSMRKQQGDF